MIAKRKSLTLRVEHVVNQLGEGSATSLPMVVSDSRPLLRTLLDGLGYDDYSPMQWDLSGCHEPFAVWQHACFNRAAGWRLRERLHTLVGSRWRWRHAWRTREFGMTRASSGRVEIPIERLWMVRYPAVPGPADMEWFRGWGNRKEFGLWNDGLIAVDLSRVRGLDEERASSICVDVVARLLGDVDIWNVIGRREGLFDVRLRGQATALTDMRRMLCVHWKNLRYRGHVAEVTIAAPEASSARPDHVP